MKSLVSAQPVDAGTRVIDDVQEKFRMWRRTEPPGRRRIPEELWREAVSLAGSVPLSRISKILRLEYTGLKRRVTRAQRSAMDDGFVETTWSCGDGREAPSRHLQPTDPHAEVGTPRAERTVVAEVTAPRGMILRLYSSETAAIIKAFVTA